MPLQIMIVEDEPMIALDLQDTLEGAGHKVLGVARSMEEALGIAAKSKPQLAIVDIELHGEGDGLDTAQALGTRYGVSVLFLTGRSDFLVRAMALDIEPLGFISKPFKQGEVLDALRGLH